MALFGRTATLNAATHCASLSSISPGPHAYVLVADVPVYLYGALNSAFSCGHPRDGPAAAPDRLERPGPRPAGRRAQRGGDHRLAGGDLARRKRTAADLGGWIVFEDESGQGLRPPKGRTWGRRGTAPVRVTGGSNKRVSLAALIAIKPGCRPRLIYRVHSSRRHRKDQRKGFTEADYARLLDAAHQQLAGPLVVVWDYVPRHIR